MSWGDDLSYSWLMIAAARLGKRDIVHAYLYDLLILLQLKRNGLFATKPCDISERDSKISIFNTVGGFTQGLTEMFLQSYDGLLRVFPATPNGYTSAFAGLKAAGNVSVSASQVDGRLCRIHLVAGSAGLIRLRNDWGAVRITLPDSNVVTVVDEIIELPAKPDDVFVIEPVESRPKFALSWETASPERPRTWSGPQYLERVPKDQEWTVTIGQRSLL